MLVQQGLLGSSATPDKGINRTPKHLTPEQSGSQNAAKPQKTAKSSALIPREGIERHYFAMAEHSPGVDPLIPREGIESFMRYYW
ncbi:MAG: hypothetical protein N3H84_04695, partial [Candidatus Caldarchaeum sp.]|nr:hypothetical protein [Candidatus Caldarchaeum sp.]